MKELIEKEMVKVNGGLAWYTLKRFIITKEAKKLLNKYNKKSLEDESIA